MTTFRKLAAISALLLAAGTARAAPPATFTYSGFLLDNAGTPVTGPASMTFSLYAADTGGSPIYTQTIAVAPGTDGYFSEIIGLGTVAIPPDAFQTARYLGVKFGAEPEMQPRVQLSSVPSAFSALTAASVDWAAIQNRPASACSGATPFVTGIGVNGAVTCGAVPPGDAGCTNGQILKYNGIAWVCAADDTGAAALTATGPLSISGSTISMSAANGTTPGYVTAADFAAFAGKQARVTGTCPAGQYIRAIDAGGNVTCDMDSVGTLTGITPGPGLTGGGTTGNVQLAIANGAVTSGMLAPDSVTGAHLTVASVTSTHIADGSVTLAKLDSAGCADGNVIKWIGALGWVCAADDVGAPGGGITTVTAGAGLTGGGTGTTVTLDIAPEGVTSTMLGFWSVTSEKIAPGSVSLYHLAPSGCLEGDVPKRIGAGWGCSVDNTGVAGVQAITAGTGLTGGTITGTGQIDVDTNVIQARVTGGCTVGSFVTSINPDGTVNCGTDAGGTVTSIDTSTGLIGGPISTTGTIGINWSEVQARVSGFCGIGQFITAVGSDGSVTCTSETITPDVICPAGSFLSAIGPTGTATCVSETTYAAGPGLAQIPAPVPGMTSTLFIADGSLTERYLNTPQAGVVASTDDVVIRHHFVDLNDLNGADRGSFRVSVNGNGEGGWGWIFFNTPAGQFQYRVSGGGDRAWTYQTPEFGLATWNDMEVVARADDSNFPMIIRDLQFQTSRSAGPMKSYTKLIPGHAFKVSEGMMGTNPAQVHQYIHDGYLYANGPVASQYLTYDLSSILPQSGTVTAISCYRYNSTATVADMYIAVNERSALATVSAGFFATGCGPLSASANMSACDHTNNVPFPFDVSSTAYWLYIYMTPFSDLATPRDNRFYGCQVSYVAPAY